MCDLEIKRNRNWKRLAVLNDVETEKLAVLKYGNTQRLAVLNDVGTLSTVCSEMADTSRFEGNGLSFKAKLIGVEDVPEARGDQMCQDALIKLKNAVRASGEHKQKIFVNVTLEGLKIVDAISLAANQNKKKGEPKNSKPADENEDAVQEPNGAVLHSHAVHRISFISRDVTDNRAFGYIFGDSDNTHKFFAIKTAAAAEQLVYTIRDLFQAVYDMKKKEMEEAKEKLEKGEVTTTQDEGNSQTPGNGSTSGIGQTPQTKQNAEGENIYQVPPNNAPVKQEPQAEQAANLLDLEDQTEHILKGIEQIKNLEFDSINEDQQTSPVSPISSPLANFSGTAPTNPDPWGMAATSASTAPSSTSALGDLAGLQTNSFTSIQGGMQPFPGTPFTMQAPYGGATVGFPPGAGGLPVSKDPFGNDPFSANAQRPSVPTVGGFPASNPFGGGGFPSQQLYGAPARGMMPGAPGAPGFMGQPGFAQAAAMGRAPNPFGMGFNQMQVPVQQGNLFKDTKEDTNLLQPMRKDSVTGQREESTDKAVPKKLRDDLFGDLVDIKKSPGSSADSPKDMFAKASGAEKKSMNALMAEGPPTPPRPSSSQASTLNLFPSEPFGSSDSPEEDKTRSLLTSHSEDPFDTTHICPALSDPTTPVSSRLVNSSLSSIPADTPPPVPKRPPKGEEINKDKLSCVALPKSLSSSSSSSSSSSRSSSPSSSTKSHSEPPRTKPPPLPKRLVSNPSASSQNCDVMNVRSPPLELALSDIPADSNTCTLPSPDEPPPPLPVISFELSAPPPPPRPSTSSLSTLSPTISIDSNSTTEVVNSALKSGPALPHDNIKPSGSPLSSESSVPKSFSASNSERDFSEHFGATDEVFFPAGSRDKMPAADDWPSPNVKVNSSASERELSNLSPKVVPRDPADPFSPPLLSYKPKSKSKVSPNVISSTADKPTVDQIAVPSSSSNSAEASESDSSDLFPKNTWPAPEAADPFKVPLHLMPGFKVEAKFGNDPFDDSFTEVLQARFSESKWDPFSPGPNTDTGSGKSTVQTTDPFGAPLQPVNGNTTGNSLFD
ncbi:disabled homolog 1-like [Plakobranchus ocellatus]|uniref:Disabled homolog 1-like n=1 Tax=Plakobranchus ocellatus TaxID=259542 RepID=A0AAV3XVP5_9GAST|nr:disabled homolog 1-like [Plakobranchus ocellatus]